MHSCPPPLRLRSALVRLVQLAYLTEHVDHPEVTIVWQLSVRHRTVDQKRSISEDISIDISYFVRVARWLTSVIEEHIRVYFPPTISLPHIASGNFSSF